MVRQNTYKLWLVISWLVMLLITWLVQDNIFFWDTVQLGAKHAYWYYENNFAYWLLPAEIDSGHPPVFGIYLALMWKLWGKSLAVSHFAMLPFLLGIVYFLLKIGKLLASEASAPQLLLLAFADPTLTAQCILISPDVVLVCFFLMGLCAIFYNWQWLKILAALGLAMISLRGMMAVAALFLFDVIIYSCSTKILIKVLIRKVLPYLPAGAFAAAFLIWHYWQTGWIGYHPDSPWAPSFMRVGASGFLKNIAILGWRLLEFGRIFIWVGLIFVVLQKWRARQLTSVWQNGRVRHMILFLFVMMLILSPSLLLHRSLSAQRYLLPIYLALTLLLFIFIFNILQNKSTRNIIFTIAFLGLLTGNLWIYSDKIAQGWDATLAHLPYYQLRAQMLEYLERQNIPPDIVGTAFPEIGAFKYKDLSDHDEGFLAKDLSTQYYILYSNIMNDFSDAEIYQLRTNWQVVAQFKKRGVKMILYHKE